MQKTRMSRARRCFATLTVGAWASIGAATAQAEAHADLTELSLQELTNVKVTTLAKRPQRARDVAAALFVITQDDIRRSGARSIPDALQLAPGLQVAQIDGNKWAISARGFSGRFANKLLVLMDGRTLYTPSFAGVYWDAHDTLIDDVERIEVIRGPAGTTWGTNAVNGIINIITKRADQTDGLLVRTDADLDDSAALNVRFGDADDEQLQWRVYAKALAEGANELSSGADAYDDSKQARVGGRLDADMDHGQQVRLAMEAYQGRSGHTFTGSFFEPNSDPNAPLYDVAEAMNGLWAAAAWSRDSDDGSRIELQTYFDHSSRDGPIFGERRKTIDIDLQQALTRWGMHTITWGLGVRHSRGDLSAIGPIDVRNNGTVFLLGSAYLQDEITLFSDRLTLTAGARIEDSNRDALEVLPNLRARVSLTEHSTLWGAIGRGVRRPARIEQDFVVQQIGDPLPPGAGMNPFPIPAIRSLIGSDAFESEQLTAYEAGWRWQARENLSVDVAAFYNEYEQLRSLELLAPYCMPSGELVASTPACMFEASAIMLPATAGNSTSGHVRGGELALGWAPLSNWRLTGAYSYLDAALRGITPDPVTQLFILGQDPKHQYSLRSSLSIGPRWDWDLVARRRSEIASIGLPATTQLDTRIAWRPALNLEVAFVGRNLLDDADVQAASELFDIRRIAIQRDASVQLRWSFR